MRDLIIICLTIVITLALLFVGYLAGRAALPAAFQPVHLEDLP